MNVEATFLGVTTRETCPRESGERAIQYSRELGKSD
jgi:hypothetical protein